MHTRNESHLISTYGTPGQLAKRISHSWRCGEAPPTVQTGFLETASEDVQKFGRVGLDFFTQISSVISNGYQYEVRMFKNLYVLTQRTRLPDVGRISITI